MKYEEFKSELDNLLKGTEIEDVMSDVFSYMDESDFYSMKIVDEKVNTWISEQNVLYYSRAINYLKENDPSLRNAFAAAEEYGFTLDNLDSEKLATILLQSNMQECWGEIYSDVEELISELNDGEEEEDEEQLLKTDTIMKRAIYKTEKCYFGTDRGFTDIRTFFDDRQFRYRETKENKYERINMIASDDLKRQIAARFVERHFGWRTKVEKERIINALVKKECDLSYLQCFYTSGSNSLSGEAYSFCKRKFLQSIW